LYICWWSLFWIKNLCVLLMSSIFKTFSPKTLDRTVYVGFVPGYFESDPCSNVCFNKPCTEFQISIFNTIKRKTNPNLRNFKISV
jgi:hypothetical protein